ncbi:Ran-binding protein 9 [Holothuria leucospilota]|uniref:Ran-binding protein 9 n=1 Tax=Holothuria leucospilota TaxID=206669 RepID=A0A9Q1HCN6_HOLLE|nr:Ran-binding protein 9 [Holothuria leucospilota]
MASHGASSSSSSTKNHTNSVPEASARIKRLYPCVDEDETPLPRQWNSGSKPNFIALTQNNLRVHYKGAGKTPKEAASVITSHPIPPSCGIYYFEVTIVSKGREGYMAIGLSTDEFASNLSRLPGSDKHSYGYNADSGNVCNSTNNHSTGIPYGPSYTTGDVVGCGINLVDNSCFYTRNGVHLGDAFKDLPNNLYPTVGLQTPGESVDTNFGQHPFVFDIEDMMQEMRFRTFNDIRLYPVQEDKRRWQSDLHKIVTSYLVHHGYCATAESFAKSTNQKFDEDIVSIKNRQRIQKLVLNGQLGEAIETTQRIYPGLLENNQNLEFMLKCRQFVEMVNGTESEVRGLLRHRSRSTSRHASPAMSPSREPSSSGINPHLTSSDIPVRRSGSDVFITKKSPKSPKLQMQSQPQRETSSPSMSEMNALNAANGQMQNGSGPRTIMDMDIDEPHYQNGSGGSSYTNGEPIMNGTDVTNESASISNGSGNQVEDMETEERDERHSQGTWQLCGGNNVAVEKMLEFGKELQAMHDRLPKESGKREANQKALQDAFSLLAYSDPWKSPVGYQLDPLLREPVCASLNSAILESQNMSKTPPLELALRQVRQTGKLMSKFGPGTCAFTNLEDYLK